VRSCRDSYHSQADSAGSIPVIRSTREKRCSRTVFENYRSYRIRVSVLAQATLGHTHPHLGTPLQLQKTLRLLRHDLRPSILRFFNSNLTHGIKDSVPAIRANLGREAAVGVREAARLVTACPVPQPTRRSRRRNPRVARRRSCRLGGDRSVQRAGSRGCAGYWPVSLATIGASTSLESAPKTK
jgi:hypothetical protein